MKEPKPEPSESTRWLIALAVGSAVLLLVDFRFHLNFFVFEGALFVVLILATLWIS